MKSKTVWVFLVILVVATAAGAQTRISGTGQVGEPEKRFVLEVPDRPGHSVVIIQGKFTWTRPWEIAGILATEGVYTEVQEITDDTTRFQGIYVDTMANGDKVHYRYRGTATMKDGALQSFEHKWEAIQGTGKLQGIQAQGTCKGSAGPDGTVSGECEGEYELGE